MTSSIEETTFGRAAFLKAGGALIVAIGLPAAAWPRAAGAESGVAQSWPVEVDPSKLDSWLAIHADGTITILTGKTENHQGNRTAIPQIVAEELDVPVARVRVLMGDTARTVDQGPTVGSLTIALGGPQLRQAAANARQALLSLAAARLGVPASDLTVKDGVVSALGDPFRRVSYAELVAGRLLGVSMPVQGPGRGFGLVLGGAQPKAPSKYTIVGQSVPRVEIPDKVTGKFTYIQDVRVPGMLHGRVIRPTGLGSQLLGHGKPAHAARVVRLKNFLG